MNKVAIHLALVSAIAGCANSPQPPASVVGEYRPINTPDFRPPSYLAPKVFDFKYRGDPEHAMEALRELQPQLTVIPSTGDKVRPGLVNVDLRQVTLEKALFEIGKQGGSIYEVIYKPDTANGRDFVFIKYLK